MRTAHLLTLIAAATVSLSAAAAPDAAVATSQAAAVTSVPVVAPFTAPVDRNLRAADYGRLQGAYKLADGRILNVSMENGKLYAEAGNVKTQIIPAGGNKFVSSDDKVRVTFDQVPFAQEVKLNERTKG